MIEDKINAFLKDVRETEGFIPKFAHNLYKDKDYVCYGGPFFDDKELCAAIKNLLLGKWISSGEACIKFERSFSQAINNKYSFFCNSGSSADLLLIAACKEYFNWPANSSIITSVVGFPTTISAIIYNKLTPIFVDIDFSNLNFDLNKIEEKITDTTKAIFLSPMLGIPVDMDRLLNICDKYNIKLLGDFCDALLCGYNGKQLSEYVVGSTCSFYPAHEISTLEGGMVSSNNEEIIKLAKSYGTWGRACFPAGTKILTDKKLINIENIKEKDKVFTHLGNFKNVIATSIKKYDGDLITIKCEKKQPIISTSNHKFLIIRTLDGRLSHLKSFPKTEWIEAKDVKLGDFLLEKVPLTHQLNDKNFQFQYETLKDKKTFSLMIEADLMRLIGYWLAEGSATKSLKGKSGYKKNKYYKYTIEFAFHEEEKEYIKDVKNLIKKYFNVSSHIQIRKNTKGIALTSTTRKGYEFFSQCFGKGASNKHLPEFFICLDNFLLKQMIKSFWRGDGSSGFDKRAKKKICFSFCSTSEILIEQMRKILLKFKINPSVHIRTPEQHHSSMVNGVLIQAKHNLTTLSIYGLNSKILNSVLDEDYTDFSPRNYFFFTEDFNYALFPVRKVLIEKVNNLDVYNFSVEKDESYHANNFVVHNCYCVATANLSLSGTCGCRFKAWLEEFPDLILDHRYLFDRPGFNLKGLDICAAIGIEQLKKLDYICEKRKFNQKYIQNLFQKYIKGVTFPTILEKSDWVPFGTPIICDNKELKQKLVSYLEKNKIQCRNAFSGNLLVHKGFREFGDWREYPSANEVLYRVFFLGAAPTIEQKHLDRIEKVLVEFKNE